MARVKFIIFFTVLLGTIGIGIVIPILPHYVASFGASPFIITLLFSVFSFCSFISSPVLGSLSDKFGRRPILLISIFTTFLGWLLFAAANSLWLLFLGRIIDGMAAGNISIAQGSLVDISKDKKERTSNLGLIGASFGIGFIVGPILGGLLSSYGDAIPFWITTILSFINLVVAWAYLPETNKHLQKNNKADINPLMPLLKAYRNKKIFPSLLAFFLFIMGVSGMQSIFALFLEDYYGYGATAAGLIFALSGIILALNQIIALKHFWLKYFKEPDIELWAMVITALSYIFFGIQSMAIFFIVLIITSFGQSILRVVMTSQIVGQSEKNSQGETLGIISSIQSISMGIAPIFAGMVFEIKSYYPFILSGIYLFFAFAIIYHNRKKIAKIEINEKNTAISI